MSYCWICGSIAETREHMIKRTDVARHIGTGPYPKDNRVVRIEEDGSRSYIQSPRSSVLKFDFGLCQACNTTRSQPWDRAYDRVVDWIFSHERKLRRTGTLDFRMIDSKAPGGLARLTYRYLTKAFGCALADAKAPIPQAVPAFLLGTESAIPLYVYLSRFRDLNIGDRLKRVEVHRLEGHLGTYHWGYSLDWLTISMSYGYRAARNLGRGWTGTTSRIHVGTY
jgi:hypothetical protein